MLTLGKYSKSADSPALLKMWWPKVNISLIVKYLAVDVHREVAGSMPALDMYSETWIQANVLSGKSNRGGRLQCAGLWVRSRSAGHLPKSSVR